MIKDMDFQTISVKLLVRDLGGISVAWDDSRVLVLSPLPQSARGLQEFAATLGLLTTFHYREN